MDNGYLKKRDKSIDCMKGIGIILVILGHINFANYEIKPWIYSFHMPLFFFATGLTFKSDPIKNIDDLKKYILKKGKCLIIPYILWGLIFCEFSWNNMLLVLYGSYYSIKLSGSLSSLWFLPVLFLASIRFYIVYSWAYRFKRYQIVLVGITVIAFIIGKICPYFDKGYPFCTNISFVALGFLILGFLIKYIEIPQKRVSNIAILLIISFIIVFLYLFNLLNFPILPKGWNA